MDLADVAHELYGLLPGDFTAERDSRAKDLKSEDAGLARLVKALPKPTTAAWLVNQLVRHHGDEVEQVARIGAALREAQEGLEKDQLLQLNKQRHAVLRAVTRQARALANELGKPVSTAIADEVEQTLRAVMSDPDAADAVRSGALLRSLSGTGFGPVDLTEAVAVPDAESGGRRPAPRAAKPRPAAKHGATRDAGVTDELADRRRQHEQEEKERERQREERERAERARAEARRQADEAEEEASRADDALDDAQAVVEELDGRAEGFSQRLHELERQIRDAQNELAAVQREQKTAQRDRDEARHDSEAAHRALDRARQRVERLT